MTAMSDAHTAAEARRLERLWSGDFGDEYVDRNTEFGVRKAFWGERLAMCEPTRVLEVGCNLGGNLQWIAGAMPADHVVGVDVNLKALVELRARVPRVHAVGCAARELPFEDGRFDLVFTMGVLIHQPEETLAGVMAEMVRCSSRWVLCGEYFAEETSEVHYRGHEGALFKRDYGRLFQQVSSSLQLREQGFLSQDEGWDDVTWWLFERDSAETAL